MAKFQKGNPGGPGRPKRATSKEILLKHITEQQVLKQLLADFKAGDKYVRQFVYEHIVGKPVQKSENENSHSFPDGIEIRLVGATAEDKSGNT